MLEGENTVTYVMESNLRAVNKADPKSLPNIKTFGEGKYEYWGLLFTRNSPLLPMFRKATPKTFENGIYKKSSIKWLGGEIKSQAAAETMVLSMGQTYIAFIFMVLFLFISLPILLLEIIYSKGPDIFHLSQTDRSENEWQIMALLLRRR